MKKCKVYDGMRLIVENKSIRKAIEEAGLNEDCHNVYHSVWKKSFYKKENILIVLDTREGRIQYYLEQLRFLAKHSPDEFLVEKTLKTAIESLMKQVI